MTIKKSELPQTGEPLNGGFFVGLERDEEKLYALIVAPKALGQYPGHIDWGKYGEDSAATSCHDGMANTQAMAAEGSKAAQWTLELEIDGRKDWFIPARDQKELQYRKLKPTPQKNLCSYRDGDNASSAPVGYPYTKEFPAQTTAPLFQKGGAEAFDEAYYYSSTQCSASYAYVQHFSDGDQYGSHKVNVLCVRAVRRDLVIE